ncbi:MAG: hypothetical protein JXB60_03900 [Candidatus Cloacimonetes bacterium]|nr:hypothetical protein [Candidatus Cloacimonadota bacterium]
MTKNICLSVLYLSLISCLLALDSNYIENGDKFDCLQSSTEEVRLVFNLGEYQLEAVTEKDIEYVRIETGSDFYNMKPGWPEVPTFHTLIGIADRGEVILEIFSWNEEIITDVILYPEQPENSGGNFFALADEFYRGNNIYPAQVVDVGMPAILRDQRVVDVTVNPFRYDPHRKELHIIENVEFNILCSGEGGENIKVRDRKKSRFFAPLYRSVLANRDFIQDRDEDFQQPCYLFLYPENNLVANDLSQLVHWKHQKGFEVHMVSTTEAGTSLNQIKSYIQNAYDNWENPPEFVCLVADAGGNFSLPTGHIDGGNYNGEGDHFYALLEGNDILADVFLGRLSYNDILELETILSKILHYEKEPYLNNLGWYERALMVGDPTDSGPSTVTTCQSIVEMMSYEVPQIDCIEVYEEPWVQQISSNLNNGVLYFHYRGFANMSGWYNANTFNLNNGYMLPVVSHITCLTGDFEGTVDCRSEAFLKAGSPSTPRGAIAAIGTSTGNTHTCFNNIVSAGTFFGIFQDKIYNMGGALTRGKVALYINYPGNPANHVAQFSYWNNLMGDPGMELWTGVPQTMLVNYEEEIAIGSNYLPVFVSAENGTPLSEAWVTALKGDDEIFATGFTAEDGMIMLPVQAEVAGDVDLTVTKHDFIPHLGSFSVVMNDVFVNSNGFIVDDDNIGNSSGNDDNLINPGEIIELFIGLKNSGTGQAFQVELTASSGDDRINIIGDSSNYGNIPSGATRYPTNPLIIEFDASLSGGISFNLELEISDDSNNNWSDLVELDVVGPYLFITGQQVLNATCLINPGETADLSISVENIGLTEITGVQGILTCESNYIVINDNQGSFGDIGPGEETDNTSDPFNISASDLLIDGTNISFRLDFSSSEGYAGIAYFILSCGETEVTDPLGPDAYGYYCYDDGDLEYYQAPQYQWIEIDPDYGGNGTVLDMLDYGNMGDNEVIAIPINFRFYGQEYNQITVGSDGWICPGITDQTAFMNWHLPGPLGPSPMVAVFWDDLIIDDGHICYYHDVNSHYCVIEWSRLKNEFNYSLETFEIIIYDADYYPTSLGDSELLLQYQTVNNTDQGIYGGLLIQHGQFATVGLEDHSGTVGLEYTYNNSYPIPAKTLENEMALFFTGPPIFQEEPFLVINDTEIIDDNGNGNVDYGELIELYVILNNLGTDPATGLSAQLSTNDDYITLLADQSTYADIAGLSSGSNLTGFAFEVPQDCPDGHIISFQLLVNGNENDWNLNFQLRCNAPYVNFENTFIDDNVNNILDPSETSDVLVNFNNIGGADASGVQISFTTTDPFLDLNISEVYLDIMAAGSITPAMINISSAPETPIGYSAEIYWDLSADLEYQAEGSFIVYIAQIPVSMNEGFEIFPPLGWAIEGGSSWFLIQSNFAGGEIPEVLFFWSSQIYTVQRLTTFSINTLGSTSLELSFKHLMAVDDCAMEVNIVTSSDGMNWHEVVEIPVDNIPPSQENIIISNSDVGSTDFRLGFQVTGTTSNFIQWVLDDVVLTEVETEPHGFITGNVVINGDYGNLQDVMVSAEDNDAVAYPDEDGFYVLSLPPGTYDITATLAGYISQTAADIVIEDYWQVVHQDFELEPVDISYSPQNLTATSYVTDIILEWDIPGTYNDRILSPLECNKTVSRNPGANREVDFTSVLRNLLGYRIYRNYEMIGEIDNFYISEYIDEYLDGGEYIYYVTAIYPEGESQPSNILEFEHILPIPVNLTATPTPNNMHVLLNWQVPENIGEEQVSYRIYCNGEFLTEIYLLAYLHINAPYGTLYYEVTAVYGDYESLPATVTIEHTTGTGDNHLPLVTELLGNNPNPFNPETEIRFALASAQNIKLDIFNLKGETVNILIDDFYQPGIYTVTWRGIDQNNKKVSSGIYLYRMIAGEMRSTKKMILLK